MSTSATWVIFLSDVKTFTLLWFCMFRDIFCHSWPIFLLTCECKLPFDCLCLLPLRTVFTHETIWSLTCANFKSWKSKRDLKLLMTVGLTQPSLSYTHIHTLTAEWTVRVMNGAEMCSRAVEVPGQACLPPTTTQILMCFYGWNRGLGQVTVRLVFSAPLQAMTNLGSNLCVCRLINQNHRFVWPLS